MALQTSTKLSGPAPKHTLEKIFLVIAVIVAVASAQYFIMMSRVSEESQTGYVNNETGQALTKEDVRQILERQAEESMTYVFAGTVSAKMKDVFYVNDGNGTSAKFKLAPNAVITKAGDSPEAPLTAITYDDIKQGDYVSVIFPKGVLTKTLTSATPLQAPKVVISVPTAGE
jgi:hypothetical protein